MPYIVELGQSAGCDRSINCGTEIVVLEASSMAEAEAKVWALLERGYLQ